MATKTKKPVRPQALTNIYKLTESLKCGLFADRGTDVSNALEYAGMVHGSLNGADKIAAMTAMYVVINTIANFVSNEVH